MNYWFEHWKIVKQLGKTAFLSSFGGLTSFQTSLLLLSTPPQITLSFQWCEMPRCRSRSRSFFLLFLISHASLLLFLIYSLALLWCASTVGHSLLEEEAAPVWVIHMLQYLWECYYLWNGALLDRKSVV